MANDPKAMFDSGQVSSLSSRRSSILGKMSSAVQQTVQNAGQTAKFAGNTLYEQTLSEDAPELMRSHRDAAKLLLGGPVGSVLLEGMFKRGKGIYDRYKNFKQSRTLGATDEYFGGDMGNAESYDKSIGGIPDPIEEIEETFISSDDGSQVKRTARISRNGKKQKIEYKEKSNKKGKTSLGDSSLVRSGGSSGRSSNSMISHESKKYGSNSDSLSKYDYKYITNLSKSIATALDRSDEKRRVTTTLGFFGKLGVLTTLPAISFLRTARYSTELPNPRKVGVLNAIQITLGLLYMSSRANVAETNRLLYDLAIITKTGMNVDYKVRKPSEVTTATEALAAIPKKAVGLAASGALGMAKMGLSILTPDSIKNIFTGGNNPIISGGGMGGPMMMGGSQRGRVGQANQPLTKMAKLKNFGAKAGKGAATAAMLSMMLGMNPLSMFGGVSGIASGVGGGLMSGAASLPAMMSLLATMGPMALPLLGGGLGLMGAAKFAPRAIAGGIKLGKGVSSAFNTSSNFIKSQKKMYNLYKKKANIDPNDELGMMGNFDQYLKMQGQRGIKAITKKAKKAPTAIADYLMGRNKKEEPSIEESSSGEGGMGGDGSCCSDLLNFLQSSRKKDDQYQKRKIELMELQIKLSQPQKIKRGEYRGKTINDVLGLSASAAIKSEKHAKESKKDISIMKKQDAKEHKEQSWFRKLQQFKFFQSLLGIPASIISGLSNLGNSLGGVIKSAFSLMGGGYLMNKMGGMMGGNTAQTGRRARRGIRGEQFDGGVKPKGKFGRVISGVKGMVGLGGAAVAGDEISDSAGQILKGVAKEGVEETAKKGMWDSVKSAGSKAAKGLKVAGRAAPFLGPIMDVGANLIEGKGVAESVGSLASGKSIGSMIGGTVGAGLGSSIPVVGTIFGGVIGSMIGGVVGSLVDGVSKFFTGTTLGEMATKALGGLGNWLYNLYVDIGSYMQMPFRLMHVKLMETLAKTFEVMGSGMKFFTAIPTAIATKVLSLIDTLPEWTQALIPGLSGIKTLLSGYTKVSGLTTNSIDSVVGAIRTKATEARSNYNQWWSDRESKKSKNEPPEEIKPESSIKETAKEMGGNIIEKGKELGGQALSTAQQAGSQALEKVQQYAPNATATVKEIGSSAMDQFKSGIAYIPVDKAKEYGNRAIQYGTGLYNTAKNEIKNRTTDYKSPEQEQALTQMKTFPVEVKSGFTEFKSMLNSGVSEAEAINQIKDKYPDLFNQIMNYYLLHKKYNTQMSPTEALVNQKDIALNKLGEKVQPYLDTAKDTAMSAFNDVKTFTSNATNTVKSKVENYETADQKAAMQAMKSFPEQVKRAFTEFKQYRKEGMSPAEAMNKIKETYPEEIIPQIIDYQKYYNRYHKEISATDAIVDVKNNITKSIQNSDFVEKISDMMPKSMNEVKEAGFEFGQTLQQKGKELKEKIIDEIRTTVNQSDGSVKETITKIIEVGGKRIVKTIEKIKGLVSPATQEQQQRVDLANKAVKEAPLEVKQAYVEYEQLVSQGKNKTQAMDEIIQKYGEHIRVPLLQYHTYQGVLRRDRERNEATISEKETTTPVAKDGSSTTNALPTDVKTKFIVSDIPMSVRKQIGIDDAKYDNAPVKQSFVEDLRKQGIDLADIKTQEQTRTYNETALDVPERIDSGKSTIAPVPNTTQSVVNNSSTSSQSSSSVPSIPSSSPSSSGSSPSMSSTSSSSGGAGMSGGAVEASPLYSELGVTPEQWDIYRNTVAKIESGGKYDIYGGSSDRYDGRYQMGPGAKADGARIAGVANPGHSSDPNDPARVAYRQNPELQETLFTAFTIGNHRYLMKNETYRNASPERKLQILGYAHNQGMGGAEKWINTGVVGSDGFGTKGTKYTDAIAANLKAHMGTPASSPEDGTQMASMKEVQSGTPVADSSSANVTNAIQPELNPADIKAVEDEKTLLAENSAGLTEKPAQSNAMTPEQIIESEKVSNELNSARIGNNVSKVVGDSNAKIDEGLSKLNNNVTQIVANTNNSSSSSNTSSTNSSTTANNSNEKDMNANLPPEVSMLIFAQFD